MSTYTPIASITLASATAEITFTGIPQTYTDLVLVVAGTYSSGGVGSVDIRVGNGSIDTGSNYSATQLDGFGSSAASYRDTSATNLNLGVASTSQSTNIFHFMNYANTTTNKTILSRGNEPTYVRAAVGLWRSTSAINQIRIRNSGGTTFASNTTFNLYGINAQESAQAKATGGQTIIRDSSYWYHVFNSSGTFTPTQNITGAEFLVVAGGGGGGEGGAGAGGLRSATSQTFNSGTAYTITVGAGGVGSANTNYTVATAGSNSSIAGSGFSTFSCTGGAIGRWEVSPTTAGGSGGGGTGGTSANSYLGTAGNAGGYTPVEGYAGGNGDQGGSPRQGGGGGGAGGAGGKPTAGVGSSAFSAWGSATSTGHNVSGTYYYAGGGGGGSQYTNSVGVGGNGGGGTGRGTSTDSTSGMANTGGGGGAGANLGSSGNGGSGIVIIRYAV